MKEWVMLTTNGKMYRLPLLLKRKKDGKWVVFTFKCGEIQKFEFDDEKEARKFFSSEKSRRNSQEKDDVMRGLGLTKVKGNLGGTYWE